MDPPWVSGFGPLQYPRETVSRFRTNFVQALHARFCYTFQPVSDLQSAVSTEEATGELNAVLASSAFTRSPRLSHLLRYLCAKFLAGEADQIKEYSIGVEVLQRPPSFDPSSDAGARVEVHRLRRRLQQFYESEGAGRKLRIVIPVGHYIPAFVQNSPTETVAAAALGEAAEPTAEVPFGLVADILAREPETRNLKPRVTRGLLITAGRVLMAATVLMLWTSQKPARSANSTLREAALAAPAGGSVHPAVFAVAVPGNSVRFACGRSVT